MKVCIFVAFIAGTAATAFAQTSLIYNEVSTDGGSTWSSNTSAVPGSTVHVRTRVRLEGATALGLAALTMQPVMQGWRADLGDTAIPFTFPGLNMTFSQPDYGTPTTETSYSGRNVINSSTNTGRMFPFGASGQGDTSSSGLLRPFNDPGNTLRFAGSRNITATTNTAWGVSIGQLPQQRPAPYYAGAFFDPSLDAVVFRYAVTLSTDDAPRSLLATIPAGLITLNQASWYILPNGTQLLRVPAVVQDSVISVVPAPGATALALVGVATFLRRRR